MGTPTARVETELELTLDEAFERLVDFSGYPGWNPFVVKVEGAPRAIEGARVRFTVRWPDGGGAHSGEVVTRVVGPSDSGTAEVAWRFTGPLAALGLVRAERIQVLTRISPSRTRYLSEERFFGLLAGLVPLARVQAGFEAQAAALARK